MKEKWEVIHECDTDNGDPTQWCIVINSPVYGKFCWIDDMVSYFGVNVAYCELKRCKSLTSAKRWVTMNLLNKGDE